MSTTNQLLGIIFIASLPTLTALTLIARELRLIRRALEKHK